MTSIDLIRGGYDDMHLPDQFELPRQGARYTIDVSVGEQDKPEVAWMARRIHGISYAEFGYVTQECLDEDGCLLPELDGSRDREDGTIRVSYMLAHEIGKPIEEARATMRLIDVGENGTVDDLPTCQNFKDVFSPEIKAHLHELSKTYRIREAGSLGAIGGVKGHLGSYENMRAAIQSALIQELEHGQPTLFLVSMTPKSIRPIIEFVGKHATEQLSGPAAMFSDDPRKAIDLEAAVIDPHKIIDGILDDIEAAKVSNDTAEIVKRTHKLAFMTDGLPDACIGDRAIQFLGNAAA